MAKLYRFLLFSFLIVTVSFSAIDINPLLSQKVNVGELQQKKQELGISDQQLKEAAKDYFNLSDQGPDNSPKQNSETTEPNSSKVIGETDQAANSDTDVQTLKDQFKSSIEKQFPKRLNQYGYSIFNQTALTFTPLQNIPVPGDYVLGPGDELKIFLWGNLQQNFSVVIDNEGNILLPAAGKVSVANLSLDKAKDLIESALKKHFANVSIDVTMGRLKTIEVFVLGDVKTPGKYNVSSLSTMLYALYASGGPTKMGTLRDIQLIRNAKVVKRIDLYELFLFGDKSGDVPIKPGDTIFVPKIGLVAAVDGEVKTPAIYELKGQEKLSDLIALAGRYTRNSYVKELNLIRKDNESDQFVLKSLSFASWQDFEALSKRISVLDGDVIEIKRIEDRLTNWVNIEGNVRFPGLISLDKAKSVQDLIKVAGGFYPDSYLKRVDLFRINSANHRIIIPLDLTITENYKLNLVEYDKIVVYSVDDQRLDYSVNISGALKKPGQFYYFKNMTLADLLFQAGPLNYFADLENIYIRRVNSENLKTLLTVDLNVQSAEQISLNPFDEIEIFSRDKSFTAKSVSIIGEVNMPGEYEFTDQMTLADLIFMAKSFTPFAETGRFLIHRKLSPSENKIITVSCEEGLSCDVLLKPLDEVFVRRSPSFNSYGSVVIQGEVIFPGTYPLYKNETLTQFVQRVGGFTEDAYIPGIAFYRKLKDNPNIERISNDFATTADKSLTAINRLADFDRLRLNYKELFIYNDLREDLILKDGDQIVVNSKPQEVRVVGGVYNQGSFLLKPGEGMGFYINKAGRFRKDSDRGEIYVVHADGTVTKTNSMDYRIFAGDAIVVPTKDKTDNDFWKWLLDFSQIIFNITTTWKVIFS